MQSFTGYDDVFVRMKNSQIGRTSLLHEKKMFSKYISYTNKMITPPQKNPKNPDLIFHCIGDAYFKKINLNSRFICDIHNKY